MIPALTETGRSFKGVASYYLSDKQASASSPGTTGRVAWTETLNLPTSDPDRAWRMTRWLHNVSTAALTQHRVSER